MSNHFTCRVLDEQEIIAAYRTGESTTSIAHRLKINTRRLRRIFRKEGVVTRTPSKQLLGNQHHRKYHLDHDELVRLYVQEEKSIRAITQITGCKNVRYHLILHGIPRRSFMTARTGKGDNIPAESRARLGEACRGERHPFWKGGLTPVEKLFYQRAPWRKISMAAKQRDGLTCRRCGKQFPIRKLRAHHILARTQGGADNLDNLITYCNPCHRRVHFASTIACQTAVRGAA